MQRADAGSQAKWADKNKLPDSVSDLDGCTGNPCPHVSEDDDFYTAQDHSDGVQNNHRVLPPESNHSPVADVTLPIVSSHLADNISTIPVPSSTINYKDDSGPLAPTYSYVDDIIRGINIASQRPTMSDPPLYPSSNFQIGESSNSQPSPSHHPHIIMDMPPESTESINI